MKKCSLSIDVSVFAGGVLVTGGLGSLGVLVASWIASQGTAQSTNHGSNPLLIRMQDLYLPSRSGHLEVSAQLPGTALHQLLTMSGALVTIAKGDMSVAEDSAAITSSPTTQGRCPITTVLHASGVLQVCHSKLVQLIYVN